MGLPRVRPAALKPVEYSDTMAITLLRQESGFGFRIVGGTEEGSQVSSGLKYKIGICFRLVRDTDKYNRNMFKELFWNKSEGNGI